MKIKNALISVSNKTGLEPIVRRLFEQNVKIYSTGGTQTFIEKLNIPVIPVEKLTNFPEILDGRVKTLHPKVFGGILNRPDVETHQQQIKKYEIPNINLVIVDLYPFEQTLKSDASHEQIIENIDIGGIALIRAAAKNYEHVVTVASKDQYENLLQNLQESNEFTLSQRKKMAAEAFKISSHYDAMIANYISDNKTQIQLRYGENPHQKATFFGEFDEIFDKINGKEISYNNLLDIDAAVALIAEFNNEKPTFAILKHTNACGVATKQTIKEAYESALAGDPISAFGGILIANATIDIQTAKLINDLFFEVVIAPNYEPEALEILCSKKNRIVLVQKKNITTIKQKRTILNGFLEQNKDLRTETIADLDVKTKKTPTENEIADLIFANKIVKHTKSNAIVLAKNQVLLASGVGQTSRVDALEQAILKSRTFDFDLKGAVMASDAFFPFPDCVEIAHKAGIKAVVQPGGSIKDQLSIDYCDAHQIAMAFTGIRHFKH